MTAWPGHLRRRGLPAAVLSGAMVIATPLAAQLAPPPSPLPQNRPEGRLLSPETSPLPPNGYQPGARPLQSAPEPGLLPAEPETYQPYRPGHSPGSPRTPGPSRMGMPGMAAPPPAVADPEDWYYARPPARIRDYSWIYIDSPRPQEIRVHDIVTIVVNEKARFDANTQFNRTRNATLKAELKEFIRLGNSGNLNTAASNQPTIDTNLNGRLQTNGQAVDSEGVNYRIAATVVDILPNGYLVLEARKSIRTNRDLFEYSLTGTLRPDDISPRNEAYSEDIANLQIVRRSRGKIYNSTRRPWGLRLYDVFFPF